MKKTIIVLTALIALTACSTDRGSEDREALPPPPSITDLTTSTETGGELTPTADGCTCVGEPGTPGTDGADGSSCTTAPTATGVVISCTDGTSAEVLNGAPGAPGASGAVGSPGSSCSVEQADAGATVSCTDGTSAVVFNGAPGPMGPAGPASTVPGPQGERGPAGPAGADSTVPGPRGERGEVGPASTVPGPAGPAGAPGSVDASKLYLVQEHFQFYGDGEDAGLGVACDEGDVALSGGCSGSATGGGFHLRTSEGRSLVVGALPDYWACTWYITTGYRVNAMASVLCLDLP
jgi:hypothetical protein